MRIHHAETEQQIATCFPVMAQLRPHLTERQFIEQVQAQIEQGYQLDYLQGEDVVRAVIGYRVSTNLAWGKHIYVDDLVVSGDVRSAGFGTALLDHIKACAGQWRCEQIHLDSGVQRYQAHRFYLREGFVISSHHFTFDAS